MAPSIAIPAKATVKGEEAKALRQKNEELDRELKKSREREEKMREELEGVWRRVMVAEEAEERLCRQLGEVEAEAVYQAREYRSRIAELTEQLSGANRVILQIQSMSSFSSTNSQ